MGIRVGKSWGWILGWGILGLDVELGLVRVVLNIGLRSGLVVGRVRVGIRVRKYWDWILGWVNLS